MQTCLPVSPIAATSWSSYTQMNGYSLQGHYRAASSARIPHEELLIVKSQHELAIACAGRFAHGPVGSVSYMSIPLVEEVHSDAKHQREVRVSVEKQGFSGTSAQNAKILAFLRFT